MQYLSAAEAESLSDEDLDEAVFHHILHRVSQNMANLSEQQAAISALPTELRQLYAVRTLELEIYNGGFNQYFFNRGDTFVLDAVRGYQTVGAARLAEVTERAADTYQLEREAQERVKLLMKTEGLQAFSDSYKETRFIDFDEPFYKAEEEAEVRSRRAVYMRQHPKEFELFELEACWEFLPIDYMNESGLPSLRSDWIDPCPLRKDG